jgi:hypothetical protein
MLSVQKFQSLLGEQRKLWPVFNFALRGKCDPGYEVGPRGELCLLGLKTLCSPLRSSREMSVFKLGSEQKGERPPLGSNLAPRCQLHPGGKILPP